MAIFSPTSTHFKPLAFTHFYTNPSPPSISSPVNLHLPSLPPLRTTPRLRPTPRLRRCLAASSGPPPPPPHNDSSLINGFSKIQAGAQIFFAVLFWMSLFFWASVWDKGDGRPKKGSRFRR